jgi:hypothetical protein
MSRSLYDLGQEAAENSYDAHGHMVSVRDAYEFMRQLYLDQDTPGTYHDAFQNYSSLPDEPPQAFCDGYVDWWHERERETSPLLEENGSHEPLQARHPSSDED